MDEHEYVDTQWTEAAKESYQLRADAFISALRDHVELTLGRQGRMRELAEYAPSQGALTEAAHAFADAEMDWCGGFPLPLRLDDEDDWDEDEDEDEDEEVAVGSEGVLSVVGRWDYRVTDADALIESARRAYLNAWPDDTPDDASFRIQDIGSAAGEILHGDDLSALNAAQGLEAYRFAVDIFTHDGTDDFDEDPFAIVRPEGTND